MAKNNLPAEKYAQPHTMSGGSVNVKEAVSGKVDPNSRSADQVTPATVAMRVSMGNPNRDDVKTSGIKMRGAGAATKGTMSRGPMA
jgi:hypothetical protein